MKSTSEKCNANAKSLFPFEEAEQIYDHSEAYSRSLKRYEAAIQIKNNRLARTIRQGILNSFSAKLTCLVASLRHWPNGQTPTLQLILRLAGEISAFRDCGEKVRVQLIAKPNGEFRPICMFGILRKALQTLCLDLLKSAVPESEIEFNRKGRGPEVLSDWMVQFIETEHCKHFVLADVKNFYGSLKNAGIEAHLCRYLPLSVIRNCVLISKEAEVRTAEDSPYSNSNSRPEPFEQAVRQGLPQGSLASNFIASMFLGIPLGASTWEGHVVHYGDDIAIGAHAKDQALSYMKTLASAMSAHPVGPLVLKRCEVRDVYQGVDFVKYRYRLNSFTNTAHVRPSYISYLRFEERVRERTLAVSKDISLETVLHYTKRWAASHPRWQLKPTSLDLAETTAIVAWDKAERTREVY